ncbi:MAG: hypothetical protein LKE37_05025 [Atopobiaceae bacterium]|jgi:hypothetical protein|nr:hypothetical protein [Atopobiaceae bacterium]
MSLDQTSAPYDLTVSQVISEERRASYPYPLRVQDRRALFDEWCSKNPDALREIESHAMAIEGLGRRVSAKWLIEFQRYEGRATLHGVPFCDMQGMGRCYAINNTDTPLLARWLKARHPQMRIDTRRSMYDEA